MGSPEGGNAGRRRYQWRIRIRRAAENDPANPVSHGERYAERYEINMLRCIFCGMCEEACPEDAIWLEKNYELADYDRDNFIYTKAELVVPMEKAGYLPTR